jgi:hypothetical protein
MNHYLLYLMKYLRQNLEEHLRQDPTFCCHSKKDSKIKTRSRAIQLHGVPYEMVSAALLFVIISD